MGCPDHPEIIEGDGATVSIPIGALQGKVDIEVEIVDPPQEAPEDEVFVSDVYALTPHGTTFAEPVTDAPWLTAMLGEDGPTTSVPLTTPVIKGE